MKHILTTFLFFISLFSSLSLCIGIQDTYSPILVVVLMVKNEESVMRETLQPFVDGGVDSFFIFDTGSTDKTIEVTREFFSEHAIEHAYIEQEPFIDFATSRNRALDLAQEKFPNAAFMIMIDAEWHINDAQGLMDFCVQCLERGDRYPSYLIRCLIKNIDDFYICRLIRCDCGVRFGGAVHEAVIQQSNQKVPENIYIDYQPSRESFEIRARRFERDRDLLFKEHGKKPFDTRTLFYLARTCEDMGDLEAAYDFYKKRVALIGWPEEDFIANYRLAHTIEKLASMNENYRWSESLEYYLKAFQMRPHRAEPLVSIANYYVQQDEMDVAFLYARRAVEIPYPVDDILFIEKYVYDCYRYELLSRCAWYIQEYKIGEMAVKKAVKHYPQLTHLRHNLACYLNRKMRAA